MSARTGLAAEVPTLELCRQMAKIPALGEAFNGGKSTLMWQATRGADLRLDGGWRVCEAYPSAPAHPAPTVREMLVWLDVESGEYGLVGRGYRSIDDDCLTNPDSLARACIAAAGGTP